ncbi:hypothetical protein [Pseudonocardia sp. ICBG1142]|uniref:hypothetical protein n=1 Tax=Pseudonocardia sp. ICBG1142 TaxID=2846760 RepID=UPI001CF6C6A1|nr:hypothetical protein [Pseudonocardia sp. ICBG1142]
MHARADHLLAAIVVGGLLSLLGVCAAVAVGVGRIPVRVAPARGAGHGAGARPCRGTEGAAIRGTPDGEQRRLIAVDVLADARLPQVTGVVVRAARPAGEAAVTLGAARLGGAADRRADRVVLALLGWRTWTAHALHRLADRRHTVPRYEESGAPWRPWP